MRRATFTKQRQVTNTVILDIVGDTDELLVQKSTET
jgi:hypothetical protein